MTAPRDQKPSETVAGHVRQQMESAAIDRTFTPRQAADFLGVKLSTLYSWTCASRRRPGLRFLHYGRRCIRFKESDLRQFQEQHAVCQSVETTSVNAE